jgi:hypothetical protein
MPGFNNTPPIGQRLADNVASNVSGIFSTKAQAKYASGARCQLKINGGLVGFAFDISWRMNTTVVEVNTIDDYLPYELAPQRITCEGTLSALHIPGTSTGTLLWQPDILNFLFQQYISIEVRDSASDQLLFFTDKAMITSRSEDIRVDSLAQVQLSWKAIGYRDERTPELPVDLNQTTKKKDSLQSRLLGSFAGGPLDAVANSPGIANVLSPDGGGSIISPGAGTDITTLPA